MNIKVASNGNVDIKGFYNSKKVNFSGAQPEDHWSPIESLMLILLN